MKKLLYSGLTALMMLFAVGTAKALPTGITEDATFFTVTPASESTVNTGALLNITTSEDAEIMYYAFATKEEAETKMASDNWNFVLGEDYSDNAKPAITEDARAFLIGAFVDGAWKCTIVNYTIATGDLATPVIKTTSYVIGSGKISKTDYIQILWGDESEEMPEGAELWYTTDGSTPAKDGANSTQYTTAFQ